MSANAVEMALWHICYDDRGAQEFRSDPDAYLAKYHVESAEQSFIKNFDVRALLDLKVNDMLLYSFYQFGHGRAGALRYLELLNAT